MSELFRQARKDDREKTLANRSLASSAQDSAPFASSSAQCMNSGSLQPPPAGGRQRHAAERVIRRNLRVRNSLVAEEALCSLVLRTRLLAAARAGSAGWLDGGQQAGGFCGRAPTGRRARGRNQTAGHGQRQARTAAAEARRRRCARARLCVLVLALADPCAWRVWLLVQQARC